MHYFSYYLYDCGQNSAISVNLSLKAERGSIVFTSPDRKTISNMKKIVLVALGNIRVFEFICLCGLGKSLNFVRLKYILG